MLKPALVRGELLCAPAAGPAAGVWIGNRAYAVRFPCRFGPVPTGRLVLPREVRGCAVVEAVGGCVRSLLLRVDPPLGERYWVLAPVAPDPRALELAPAGWDPLGWIETTAADLVARHFRGRRDRGAAVRLAPVGHRRVRLELPGAPVAVVPGELHEAVELPAQTLRRAWWAGLREGELAVIRLEGGFALGAGDAEGRAYLLR